MHFISVTYTYLHRDEVKRLVLWERLHGGDHESKASRSLLGALTIVSDGARLIRPGLYYCDAHA